MRWEKKGDGFVEIDDCISVEVGGRAAFYVESNLNFIALPKEFRSHVPYTDSLGLQRLKNTVSIWAERNGYRQV
jgi:hypothetical protein